MTRDRYAELTRILEERRREIMDQVQEKIRDVRTESPNSPTQGVLDAAESSEADIQDEIEFALIQMKAETLHKIEEALRRLEEGTFGYCFECGEEISERRLRALPFAVRCKNCEEQRETMQQRERMIAQRRGNASLFIDMQGYPFEDPDINVADMVLPDDLLRFLPASRGVELCDVIKARALRCITAAPLIFMTGPAQHSL